MLNTIGATAAASSKFLSSGLCAPTFHPQQEWIQRERCFTRRDPVTRTFRGEGKRTVQTEIFVQTTLIARDTTVQELIIGQITSWSLFGKNWDGEGADQPRMNSIRDAIDFTRLLNHTLLDPEPMLLASGNISLFWHNNQLYADLEFLGEKRIAYFIKKQDITHKNIISFEDVIPEIFKHLLKT